ncbi:MAG: hypothetical protein NTV68_07415 [Methanomicrobiales archaeon]|nr:hypothetical protein [Methanomicrobiales archaeon]
MKLPRGTFHSIKKGILFRSLLDEIEKTRFTGYCMVNYETETCTLVLNSGIYILANYEQLEGHPAWQKILTLLDMKVDVGLTTLNAVQLQLAREFNPHATLQILAQKSQKRQLMTGISNLGTRRKEDIPGNTVHEDRLERQEKQALPPGPGIVVAEKYPAVQVSTPGTVQSPDEQETIENVLEEDGTCIDRDMEALDNMDIEEMTKRIRENCKVTIEQLDLDHLTEERED